MQRKAASGDYMAALATYRKMPMRRATVASAVAAGKSAWALGLPEVAKQEFDRAINLASVSDELSDTEKARIYFSRGVIEFQEENYQSTLVFAGKASKLIDQKGPLLSEIKQLIAESYIKLNKLILAEKNLVSALDGVRPESEGDLRFTLATCQMQLGKLTEAKDNFELVPLRHNKGVTAIRSLASIAFELRKYEEAIFWLNKGREEFAESFLDSWVDYALVKSYGEMNSLKELKDTYAQAQQKYPPSDPWFILLQAVAEENLWSSEFMKVSKELKQ